MPKTSVPPDAISMKLSSAPRVLRSRIGEVPVAVVREARRLPEEFDFFRSLETPQLFNRLRRGYRGLMDEPRFHEFPARNRRPAFRRNGLREILSPFDVAINAALQVFVIPRMRQHHRQLVRSCQHRQRVWPKEIEVHQAAEEVLAPAVPVEEQTVPTRLRHQIQELPPPLDVQHSPRVYRAKRIRIEPRRCE